MESLTDKVKDFLAIDYGYGNGSGYGYGSGSGYGYGSGYGNGDGYGSGSGDGSGFGYGSGYGSGYGYGYGDGNGDGDGSGFGDGCDIKYINGEAIHRIDGVNTIIRAVHGNIARGAILNRDLTMTPCYIVKQNNRFAHGETLRSAMSALREKLFDGMSEEERIDAFLAEHKPGVEYPCRDLYEWHHSLTGSCEMGRKQFAKDHGIDIDKDRMTIERFCELTRDQYGGEIIRKIELKIKNNS